MTSDKNLKDIAKIRSIYNSSSYEREAFHFLVDIMGDGVQDFYSPLPAIYLQGLKRLTPIFDFEKLMILDGALGLTQFFTRFKEPENNLKTLLILPKSMAHLVPLSWKKNVNFFEYTFRGEKKRSKLLIMGTIGLGINNFSALQRDLKIILSLNEIEQIDICVRAPAKIEGIDFGEVFGFDDLLNVIGSVKSNHTRMRFRKEHDLANEDMRNYYYVNIDSTNVLYFSNSIEQQLYANGLLLAGTQNRDDQSDVGFEISLNHGIKLQNELEDNCYGAGLNKAQQMFESVYFGGQGLSDLDVMKMIQSLY